MNLSSLRSSAPSTPKQGGVSFYSAQTAPSAFSKKTTTSVQHPVFRANHEENSTRKAKVQEFIKQLQAQLLGMQDSNVKRLSLKQQARENNETLYHFLSDILSLYNVSIRVINTDQSDSAMQVEPCHQPGKTIQIMMGIAALVSRFPYSFMKMIDLGQFTICKACKLKKEDHETVYNTRVLTNAMFAVDEHKTYEKIQKHFYRILLYHIEKRMPSIHEEWPIDTNVKTKPLQEGLKSTFAPSPVISHLMTKQPSLGSGSGHVRSASLDTGKKEKYMSIDELKYKEKNDIFLRIMTNPKNIFDDENIRVQVRAKFLREKLESVDPVGINQDWWAELMKGDFFVFETIMINFM